MTKIPNDKRSHARTENMKQPETQQNNADRPPALADATGSETALEPSVNQKRFRSMQLLACVKIMQAMGITPSDLSPLD